MRFCLTISVMLGACAESAVRVGDGPPSPSTETAIVAARDLPAGTSLQGTDLQAIIVPVNYLPPGTFRAPERLVGRVLRSRVLAQEPITVPALLPPAEERLAPGTRAVTVPLGAARAQVGDHVDVWWTPPEARVACAAFQGLPVVMADRSSARLEVPVARSAQLAVLARAPSLRVTVRPPGDLEPDPETACSQ